MTNPEQPTTQEPRHMLPPIIYIGLVIAGVLIIAYSLTSKGKSIGQERPTDWILYVLLGLIFIGWGMEPLIPATYQPIRKWVRIMSGLFALSVPVFWLIRSWF